MKSKIVFILPQLDEESSNHYRHIYELLQEVSKKIDIYLFVESGSYPLKKNRLKNLYLQRWQKFPANILERIGILFFLLLKNYRIFYIHQSIPSSILASLLGKIFGAKIFFWHCGMIHIYEQEEKRKDWLFRLNLRLINYLVTAHQGMKQYYQNNFSVSKSKIKIIPGWINIERFRNINKKFAAKLRVKLKLKGKKVVLFIHWLSPRKGSRELPKIIEQTAKRRKDIIFVIVGSGPDKAWLKSELAKRRLSNKVRMVGAIPNQQIPSYLGLAQVFILPSREEELGRVQLEAMAANLPIVSFSTIGPQMVLSAKQKELMVPQGDIREFVKAIERALKEGKVFIKEGQNRIQKYSLKKGVTSFSKLVN